MNERGPASAERPAKRVRQACEPCRRKKAKCPGEQPVCSLCARLRQTCMYAGERRRSPVSGAPIPDIPATLVSEEDRLDGLEAKLGCVLDALEYVALPRPPVNMPQCTFNSIPPVTTTASMTLAVQDCPVVLPTWEKVLAIAELYLIYCDCQPLPLFHRDSFIAGLGGREPEIIYAILALAIRFSEDTYRDTEDLVKQINGYAEVARSLVMKRVSQGPVELSTLQCLCLLSLVDFTNGNTHRSNIHSNLAMNLAQCSNLASDIRGASPAIREERRRCFWSICLLNRLHGGDFTVMDFSEGELPPYPQSATKPPFISSPQTTRNDDRSAHMSDQGIVAYVTMLSQVYSRAARYVRLHGKPSSIPPWSAESEYSKVIALQMELETRVPYTHRFKVANIGDRSLEELQEHREYWGPWFLNQFLYHTILCLLNHPLLLSLSLRNFRSTIPEIFLQHISDLISSHTTWIIHFINFFQEKSFVVSDPFLGYSAAVVATIELQLSFTENAAIRKEKRNRFSTCVSFVRDLGRKWPHMARLADRLERLEGAVSASYQADGQHNQSLLIDLSRFWEILEYSSNSDADSARRLFGDSLYSKPPTVDNEVSQTSPLPEPYRLDEQQPRSRTPSRDYDGITTMFPAGADYGISAVSPQPLDLSNDEFSILATNFFSQGQDFLRVGEGRDDMGNF
ncbi:hypothetical protein ASPZODRAFT_72610 [Penicilliopsis zonata CBS 506.65]|uniref:Zn(2)-C6 fungal-type domain-containing protein n=1 Tax=Penicilliopsis zonata CBS 506.65 TaxID=1073090 RepID=A0A1L9SAF3_9EURO|nr:hypothetical protein ASPZODRAFT_72610 [Penicilliopsis zonata CBS 506.65]OJJ44121.1 hypothetical protein ASPZODRAFT_72610 [Penicilliopsis zonata CBS 506.65]